MTTDPTSPRPALPVPEVLIVSYRRADLLERCLESVRRWLPDATVRVWDNRSDGSDDVRRLSAAYPAVDWVFCPDNVGFAAAVNGLMRRGSGEQALLLNPDAELLGDLAGCRRVLHTDPTVAAAAPDVEEPGHHPWDNAHREPTWVRHLVSYAGWEDKAGRFAPVSMAYRDRPTDVGGYLTGAVLLIARHAWRAVGEFDERYFLYGEEADWCHRARRRGLRLVSVPEPGVRHVAAGTVSDEAAGVGRSEQLLAQSRVRYIRDQQGDAAAGLFRAGAWTLEHVQRSKRRRRAATPAAPAADAAPRPDVVITSPTFGVGGAERQRVALANGLVARGLSVEVRALQSWGPLAADLDDRVIRTLAPYTEVAREAGAGTVLVTGTSRIEVAHGLAWRARNVPRGRWVVAHHRPAEDGPVFSAPVAAAIRRADGAVYLSEDHRRAHRRHQRLDRGRWWAVPNGVPRPDPTDRAEAAGPVRLVTASRLAPVKQVDLLVRALGRAASTTLQGADWTLDIWGDGPSRPDVEAAVPDDLRDRITLRGWCDDVPAVLRTADVLCLPSRAEGQPMAVLEAMAAGVTVVASPVAALPEMLDGGRAGHLVDPPTLEGWASALTTIVTDGDLRRRLAGAARQRAAERYSVDAMLDGYQRLLREVSARG